MMESPGYLSSRAAWLQKPYLNYSEKNDLDEYEDFVKQTGPFQIVYQKNDIPALLKSYHDEITQSLEPFAHRRLIEQDLARYIQDKIIPHAFWHEKMHELHNKICTCRVSGSHGIEIREGKKINAVRAWDHKCGQAKLCPDESRLEGQRLAERYLPEVGSFALKTGNRIFYAVLTMPNYAPGALLEGKKEIYKKWTSLLLRIKRSKNKPLSDPFRRLNAIKGALVVQEDPLSAKLDWNVHLNIMLLVHGNFDFEDLRNAWGYNLEIRHIKAVDLAKSFLEICKYQVKAIAEKSSDGHSEAPGMMQWDSALWLEWWRANKGFRRTRSYGCIFNLPEVIEPEVEVETIWLGRMRFDHDQYEVTVFESALKHVDLIQGDKSIWKKQPKSRFLSENTFHPPP